MISARSAQFFGRGIRVRRGYGRAIPRSAHRRASRQRLAAGAFFARGRQRGIGSFGDACRLRPALLRLWRAHPQPGRAQLPPWRWRRAGCCACQRCSRDRFSGREFFASVRSWRRFEFARCASRRRSRRASQRCAFVGDRCKTARACFAFALQTVERSARFAAGGAGIGGPAARASATSLISTTPSPSSASAASRLPAGFFARLPAIASRRRISDSSEASCEARSAAARAALVRVVLCRDQRLFGLAFVLFGRRGRHRVPRSRLHGPQSRSANTLARASARGFDFTVKRRQTIALRQAHGGGRRRIGRSGITVPAPQIAARRDQALARASMDSAAPRPDRGIPRRSSPGGATERRAPSTKSPSGLAPAGSGATSSNVAQIAPMMRRGFIQRRLQIVAQRGGQRGFVTGLHLHRIDQRREQTFDLAGAADRPAPWLRRRGVALRVRHSSSGLRALALRRASAAASVSRAAVGGSARRLGERARGVCRVFGGAQHRARFGSVSHGPRQGGRWASPSCCRCWSARGRCEFARRVPGWPCWRSSRQVRTVRRSSVAFRFGQRFVQRGGGASASAMFVGWSVRGCFERIALRLRERRAPCRRHCRERVRVRCRLLGLGDALAQALRRFARAGFFGVQLLALDDQAVKGGGLFRFGLAQRRQFVGGLAWAVEAVAAARCRSATSGGGGGEFFAAAARARSSAAVQRR